MIKNFPLSSNNNDDYNDDVDGSFMYEAKLALNLAKKKSILIS